MRIRKINSLDYQLLLKLDKQIYPNSNPVTTKNLKIWYKNNPEFGIFFEEKKKIMGLAAIIPLNRKGWLNLISGKITESKIKYKDIFDNTKNKEIYIHIYHIEKLNSNLNQFWKRVIIRLNKLILSLKKENKQLKISGFSGLCATIQGINLFYNKFNAKEWKFICPEVIIKKGKKIRIITEKKPEVLEKYLNLGWEYKNRCKMLILKPKEKSIIWRYLK